MRVLIGLLATICIAQSSRLTADDAELRNTATQSIRSRLASVKYVAIESREALGACVILHAYTPEQHERNVALVEKYYTEGRAYRKEQELLQKRRREIQLQDPPDEEAKQQIEVIISDHRERYPRLRPYYLKDCKFCRVVGVGQDFIEVEEIYNSDGTVLVPLSKLAKIVFPKRKQAKE